MAIKGFRPAREASLVCGCREGLDAATQREVTCGHVRSQYGSTALVRASARGHTDMVELLLDRGADLEARDRVSAVMVCASLRDGTAPGVSGGPGPRWR